MNERDYEIRSATRDGQEALAKAIAALERAKTELERYASRYAEGDAPADKAQVLNGAIHHLATNILPNLRIDLLADAQARLAKVA